MTKWQKLPKERNCGIIEGAEERERRDTLAGLHHEITQAMERAAFRMIRSGYRLKDIYKAVPLLVKIDS